MLIKEDLFKRFKYNFLKTKESFSSKLTSLFSNKKIEKNFLDMLEEQLLMADIGVKTTNKIINNFITHLDSKQMKNADILLSLLKHQMCEILAKVDKPLDIKKYETPFIILMVGVNGAGKTTTIAKLAHQFQHYNKSVMIAAGDTFRVAAIDQLKILGHQNKIPVIARNAGSDAASVIFDAIHAAKSRSIDILIIDTAGRLHNKLHLIEELKKIVRTIKRLKKDAPHEIMLTIDANTGQNAIAQTNIFHESIGLTGIILTKLDGTAKGGVIFTIADQFDIPIRYVGTGERVTDLYVFNAYNFVESLFNLEN